MSKTNNINNVTNENNNSVKEEIMKNHNHVSHGVKDHVIQCRGYQEFDKSGSPVKGWIAKDPKHPCNGGKLVGCKEILTAEPVEHTNKEIAIGHKPLRLVFKQDAHSVCRCEACSAQQARSRSKATAHIRQAMKSVKRQKAYAKTALDTIKQYGNDLTEGQIAYLESIQKLNA